MINVNLKSLVDKMSPLMRESLEAAAGLCIGRSHHQVEVEHWLLKLLEADGSDFQALLARFKVDRDVMLRQLNHSLDRFHDGSTRPPSLSVSLVEATQNAWMLASVEFSHDKIGSGHLLTALLLSDHSRRLLCQSVSALESVAPETLREATRALVGSTAESAGDAPQNRPGEAGEAASQTPSLDRFTINLTERARAGQIDAVLGRDSEIRQCIDILTRRRQNNPIFTGEAGVGKTAVVEGFAQRIAEGDVPEALKSAQVRSLDLGLLQAGASVKGEFENRLKAVIEEVKGASQPIILFIDEAHTLIGAGGGEGQGDAANLLKPALARGELRTIAATTWAEYKKYFERDPALTRRFQVVKVEEPDQNKAINMMRGLSVPLQHHHQVRILDEAVVASVTLSQRYIPGRQLPDKSVSLLDTACARVALSLSTTPAPIADLRRRIEQDERNLVLLETENATSGAHLVRIAELQASRKQAEKELETLNWQWQREQEVIADIRVIQTRIEQAHGRMEEPETATESLQSLWQQRCAELSDIQGQQPLMQANVDAQAVAEVVANWTGVPVGKMMDDEIQGVLDIQNRLQQRVIGQDHALQAVAQAVRTSRAGLTDPRKPVGVFLFVGTSGVGKTETALALADLLFGGESNITTINMSEFKEEHKVSMLLGSPPGYVGYGEGGVLTEAARRKPYSILLLDEMEKAHPGVQDIFYNLFDKGTIKDGEGRDIDFKNTLIIMTSNAGEDAIRSLWQVSAERPQPDQVLQSIRPQLLQFFKPAFLGRTTLVAYNPLNDEDLGKIAAISLQRVAHRVKQHYGADFSVDDAVLEHIVSRCQEAETGARNLEHIISASLLPALASECLHKLAEGCAIRQIHVGLSDRESFIYELN